MKKLTKATSIILLFAMLLSAMVSCGNDNSEFEKLDDRQKAVYVVEKTDEYYKNSVEQIAAISCEIDGTINGIAMKMELDGTAKRIVTNDGTDKMRYINSSEVKSVTRTGTEKDTENYTDLTAFADGYMYMGYTTDRDGEPDIYLKSPVSANEFSDFLKKANIESEDVKYAEICDNVAVTLSEDGKTYSIKITHGSDNVKEELTKLTNEITRASFGIKFDLVSFELEYTVDAKTLVITKHKIKFVTETPKFGTDQLKLTYESEITNKKAEKEPTIENLANYTETGDLRYAYFLSNRLKGLISAESVGYTMESKSEAKSGSQNESLSETDVINCGFKNNTYVYSIDANAVLSGQKVDMSIVYNGAQQKIAVKGGASQSTDTNEIIARMYLMNILNPVLYSANDVTGITVKGTENDVTTVEFEFVLDDRFENRFASLGIAAEISNGSVKMTVKFDKEMNVTYVHYKMSGEAKTMGQTIRMEGETILKDFAAGDVSGITTVKPGSSDL